MNSASTTEVGARNRWEAWDQFWFKPSDPSLIGLIRLLCGAITLYTTFAYTFRLQDWIGETGWYNLEARMKVVRHRAMYRNSLFGMESQLLPPPRNADEKEYRETYLREFRVIPPPPYPSSKKDMDYIIQFGKRFNFDLRNNGLAPPSTAEEKAYLEYFATKYKYAPARYARSEEEKKEVDEYIAKHGDDPNRLYVRGSPVFSPYFHATDPQVQMCIHISILVAMFCFMIGFCTRIASVATWFGALAYIHRNPVMLFGVDTMMTVLLLYLMIAPSGAAYSVDRLIARWWASNKRGVINTWRTLFGQRALAPEEIAPTGYSERHVPSAAATLSIRMLQIHVCIIYFVAGVAKLLGNAWWNGTALWGVLSNYEFAPMNHPMYLGLMQWIASNQMLWEVTMTTGTYFTLAFEIAYPFIVWNPKTRWMALLGAILLHGTIGMFMGLKTFAFMMLVMNMAFLYPSEVHWIMGGFLKSGSPPSQATGPVKKKGLNVSAA